MKKLYEYFLEFDYTKKNLRVLQHTYIVIIKFRIKPPRFNVSINGSSLLLQHVVFLSDFFWRTIITKLVTKVCNCKRTKSWSHTVKKKILLLLPNLGVEDDPLHEHAQWIHCYCSVIYITMYVTINEFRGILYKF